MGRPAHAAASSSPSAEPRDGARVALTLAGHSSDQTKPGAPSPRVSLFSLRAWHAWRPWILALVGGALLAGTLIVGVGWALSKRDPSWWRPAISSDRTIAKAVESGAMQQFTAVRPGRAVPNARAGEVWWRSEPWKVSLRADDANAWLNARLPEWLANRRPPVAWPAEVVQLQAEFREGIIYLGVRLRQGGATRVVSAAVEPTIAADGSLWVPARRIAVGAMPIPPSWILDSVRDASQEAFPPELARLPETRATFDAFAGRRPIVLDASLRLEGGRRVKLLRIESRDGRLELTCRTESR